MPRAPRRRLRMRTSRAAITPRPGSPLLEPRPGGPAERFAAHFGPENPVRVFIVALLAGYALLVTTMVFLGLTMINLILPIGGLGESDEDLSQWLADNRSSTSGGHLSWIGSTLAGGLVIPVVIGICLLVFLLCGTGSWPPSCVRGGARVGVVSRDVAGRRAPAP